MNPISNIWNHPKTSAAGLLIGFVTIASVLSQQGITLGNVGTGSVVALVSGLATALLGLLARDPSAAGSSTGSTQKLGAIMLCVLLLQLPFMTGCNGTTVAQNIVNWTPTIISAAETIDATVATLDPANAALILLAGTTFVAAAILVDNQAKTYQANPNATTLQQLQAQALAFQANVNTALLQAARITNPVSQQQITVAINAAVTGISAILALITTIKGSSLSPASVTAPKVAQVLPLMKRDASVVLIAAHEGISTDRAQAEFYAGMNRLQAAGI